MSFRPFVNQTFFPSCAATESQAPRKPWPTLEQIEYVDHLLETWEDEGNEEIQEDSSGEILVVGPEAFEACPRPQHPRRIDATSVPPYGYPPPPGFDLMPGMDVELDKQVFFRISSVRSDARGPYLLGRKFVLRTKLGLGFEDERNELVEILQAKEDLSRSTTETVIRATRIKAWCLIILTNQPYMDLNYSTIYNETGITRPVFFCRCASMDVNIRDDLPPRDVSPVRFGRIDFFRYRDSDDVQIITHARQLVSSRITDRAARNRWCHPEKRKLGGSHVFNDCWRVRQEYTFGDSFCGAGGTSLGALEAGLKLQWAFDFAKPAMDTYKEVFQKICPTETNAQLESVFDWVPKAAVSTDYTVDFLHLSPPCQPFAGINTHPPEHTNRPKLDAFLQVGNILNVARPRVVTLEETAGLTYANHRPYFARLVLFFVRAGFNVQWKKVYLSEYGVPQTRERLIFIATGPGEKAPPFPQRTHASDPSKKSKEQDPRHLQPFPTIWDTINGIRDADADHDVAHALTLNVPKPKKHISGHGLSNTLLTKGNSEYVQHPNGRAYTIRELAALQTFPRWFEFQGTPAEKRTQIGNAVPPLFARTMFTSLRKWLEESDDEEMRARRVRLAFQG